MVFQKIASLKLFGIFPFLVKSPTVIDCLQLSDTKTREDKKMTSFPKSCIFIFWLNRPTQNLTVKTLGTRGKMNAI